MASGEKIMNMDTNSNENTDRVHILVVDDDPGMLEITVMLLDHQGYLVTPAIGSKEAVSKLKENPDAFDAVLTDFGMPVINGVELAIMIKELSINIPFILYSGKNVSLDKIRMAQIGITEIANKPCKIDELDSIIKRAIKKSLNCNE